MNSKHIFNKIGFNLFFDFVRFQVSVDTFEEKNKYHLRIINMKYSVFIIWYNNLWFWNVYFKAFNTAVLLYNFYTLVHHSYNIRKIMTMIIIFDKLLDFHKMNYY